MTAVAAVRVIVATFSIATVDKAVIDRAMRSGNPDFEDAVQAEAAIGFGATLVVTRD